MKILLLDIETAPHEAYTFETQKVYIPPGQIKKPAYLLCFSAKWLGKKKIIFYSIHETTPKKMAQAARDLMDEADAIVGYFSSGFDVPWLNKEIMEHNILPPSPHKDIDLYRAVKRKLGKKSLPSYKLDYVLKWLKIGAKVKHEGFDLWKKCIAGDEQAWRKMKQYNIGDVKPLEQLYYRLLPWIHGHPNHNVYNDDGVMVCPACNSSNLDNRGFRYNATTKYRRYVCRNCGTGAQGRRTQLSPETRENMVKPER